MLIADKISFSVKDKKILQEIDFALLPGELLSIIGPNGAGKSTLLKILCGEEKKYSGQVTMGAEYIQDIKPKKLALQRAVLSQSISLTLPFKVSEVVMMGRYPHFDSSPSAFDMKVVEESLEQTGMTDFSERNYLTLSGGEKQRVHLARVLAQLHGKQNEAYEPKILFLDEPVNGLDLKYQQQVMKIAQQWMGKGNTVIAVLHDLNLAAQYADKILLLHQGKQVKLDTPENVLTKEIIRKVYDIEVNVVKEDRNEKIYVTPSYKPTDGKSMLNIMI